MAPTLATACAALPPEGALLAWGGPALRRMASTLLLSSSVRDRVGGAHSCAAVLRGGLGPPTPPLCRYAECTTDPILPAWKMFKRSIKTSHRCLQIGACAPASYPTYSQPWRLVGTAQRHKGGARRAGDSRAAVPTERHGGHSPEVSSPAL
jgi:hypothetical protein